MKLIKISLKNIRSYEIQEISFPEGPILLAGDIGSGKTSILLAIEYALFGLQPGQTGAALLRNECAYGEVILEMEIGGKNIVIERRLKRSQKSVVNDYASMAIDGIKKEYSITELKTKVLNLIGYPSEFIKKNNLLYRYTVYTPQEQMKFIILEDPETRLNVLRHVFGVDKYKIIRENLAIVLNKLKEEAKILQGEVKDIELDKQRIENELTLLGQLNSKIEEREENLKDKKRIKGEIEKSLEDIGREIKGRDRLETELEKSKVMIANKEESLFELGRELEELKKGQKEEERFSEEDFRNTLEAILKKRIELDKINFRQIELAGQFNNLEKFLIDSANKKERFFSINICPTCLQDVPSAHKHNILNETEGKIVKIKRELEELKKEREELAASHEKEKLDIIQLEERKLKLEVIRSRQALYSKNKVRLTELEKIKRSLEKDHLMLHKHIETIKQDLLQYFKFEKGYKLKKEELDIAINNEKNAEVSLAELKKEIELKAKEIYNLQERLVLREESAKKWNKILEINDWLSNYFLSLIDFTERNVMMKLRNEFSELFRKWFTILGGESFEARLDENFTPIIVQGGIEMDYSFLSGGERTAVALAYRLALNQTINSVLSQVKTRDLVILDEPTEGFSEAQIDKMKEVFDEMNVKQIIIVSHEPKIENFVENVIRLRKEDNTSSIVGLSETFL
ncbi:MAG: SMC family ATPase [Nanoarchaeota archaeon]|nr:SMC family ATPase [Nanoarchaeota archaeon]